MSRAMIEDGSGMKPLIVVGDKTSHGGVVVSGDGTRIWDGKPIARKGDTVICPKCSPHVFKIEEGTNHFMVGDSPAALHNYKTTCGATLIAEPAPASTLAAAQAFKNGTGHDEQFVLKDPDGAPIPDMPYKVTTASGEVFRGVTNENGQTNRIMTTDAQNLTVEPDVDHMLD